MPLVDGEIRRGFVRALRNAVPLAERAEIAYALLQDGQAAVAVLHSPSPDPVNDPAHVAAVLIASADRDRIVRFVASFEEPPTETPEP